MEPRPGGGCLQYTAAGGRGGGGLSFLSQVWDRLPLDTATYLPEGARVKVTLKYEEQDPAPVARHRDPRKAGAKVTPPTTTPAPAAVSGGARRDPRRKPPGGYQEVLPSAPPAQILAPVQQEPRIVQREQQKVPVKEPLPARVARRDPRKKKVEVVEPVVVEVPASVAVTDPGSSKLRDLQALPLPGEGASRPRPRPSHEDSDSDEGNLQIDESFDGSTGSKSGAGLRSPPPVILESRLAEVSVLESAEPTVEDRELWDEIYGVDEVQEVPAGKVSVPKTISKLDEPEIEIVEELKQLELKKKSSKQLETEQELLVKLKAERDRQNLLALHKERDRLKATLAEAGLPELEEGELSESEHEDGEVMEVAKPDLFSPESPKMIELDDSEEEVHVIPLEREEGVRRPSQASTEDSDIEEIGTVRPSKEMEDRFKKYWDQFPDDEDKGESSKQLVKSSGDLRHLIDKKLKEKNGSPVQKTADAPNQSFWKSTKGLAPSDLVRKIENPLKIQTEKPESPVKPQLSSVPQPLPDLKLSVTPPIRTALPLAGPSGDLSGPSQIRPPSPKSISQSPRNQIRPQSPKSIFHSPGSSFGVLSPSGHASVKILPKQDQIEKASPGCKKSEVDLNQKFNTRPITKSKERRRSRSSSRRTKSPRRSSKSPRRRSRSRGRRSRSPRRRSRSPRRQSRSPRRQSRSPRRQSRSPRRHSRSPRRQSRSPRKRSKSPRRRSKSPRRRSKSLKRRSRSGSRKSNSPTKRNTKSKSPTKGTIKPKSLDNKHKYVRENNLDQNKQPPSPSTGGPSSDSGAAMSTSDSVLAEQERHNKAMLCFYEGEDCMDDPGDPTAIFPDPVPAITKLPEVFAPLVPNTTALPAMPNMLPNPALFKAGGMDLARVHPITAVHEVCRRLGVAAPVWHERIAIGGWAYDVTVAGVKHCMLGSNVKKGLAHKIGATNCLAELGIVSTFGTAAKF